MIIVFMLTMVVLADKNRTASVSSHLPPIETVILEPIEIENVCIWIPAAKSGPVINRSCQTKEDCPFSCVLPAMVNHTKTEFCLEQLARLLAEHTAYHHVHSLPLTIFNGWQWEYSYSLSQYESVTYDLADRGGSWENCWEAILKSSVGSAHSQWIQVSSLENFIPKFDNIEHETNIEVQTFSNLRTRDEYPKLRKLE